MGEGAAHSAAGVMAAGLVLVWLGIGVLTGFPAWWSTTFYSGAAAVTFVMVFVIQHTTSARRWRCNASSTN